MKSIALDKTKISLLAHLLCEKRDISGSPEGIRTLVAGLRSQSPRPLDDGALVFSKMIAFGFHLLI
jgi:hypothetical protein